MVIGWTTICQRVKEITSHAQRESTSGQHVYYVPYQLRRFGSAGGYRASAMRYAHSIEYAI